MNPITFLSFALGLTLVAGSAPSQIFRPNAGDTPPTGYSRIIQLWPTSAPLAKGTASGDIPKLYYYPCGGR
jgi:hypothetical protein